MYSGVTLSGREGNNYFGGGVTVSGGTFHMYGGTIEKCGIKGGSVCYGGGVAVVYGGQFIMDSGTIKDCYAESDYIDYWDPNTCFTAMGGGVFVSGGSYFRMNGGTISNNRATNMGGGVAVAISYDEIANSGSYGTLKSSAEILGGKVEENHAKKGAGLFASGYYFADAAAICAGTPAAGATENPGLHIKDTQILNNTSTDTEEGRGGGMLAVALKSPATASLENTTVKGNKAAVGAGIASYGYYTNMNIKGVHRHGKYCAKVRRRFFCRKQYGWRKNDDHRYGPVQQHCRYRRIRCVSQKVTISAAVRSQHEFHLSRGAGRCSQSED